MEMAGVAALGAGHTGLFGFNYNRAAFNFDQNQRWARFTSGRKMANEQVDMFREDVADLTSVAHNKLKTYGPIMTMSIGYCVTVFVEGRSGLKFPGPPTFISGLYLYCLGIGFGFMTLSTWLVFHASLRAQVAAVQLRTRKVRVPVPTQRQMDAARRLASSYEEQSSYDLLRMPFVMPQAGSVEAVDEEDAPLKGKTGHWHHEGKKSKKGGKKGRASSDTEADERHKLNQMPGLKQGVPHWLENEATAYENIPGASPSGFGREAESEPYEHFELLRQAQRDWWSAEAYQRILMLYGFIHLLQGFGYWLVIHCMTDLGLIWTGVSSCCALNASAWLIFRLDVLPDKGGFMPVELAGPLVSAISIMLSYTGTPSQATQDISRWTAGLVLTMHIIQTFRFYSLAKPSTSGMPGTAREAGGRLFNESANCDAPSWLPQSFQVVMYLIAPPHPSKESQEQEKKENDKMAENDFEMSEVDMRPWQYTRVMLIFTLFGWLVLFAGRICEGVMGERMLTTNPGTPPWTRFNQWYGWEYGPVTSKHYAHVTPQRGHYSWQEPWGPQGQQELWPSDLFGFAPEADMWWSEEGETGAPYHGDNTWYPLRLKYGTMAEAHNNKPYGGDDHSGHMHHAFPPGAASSGGHTAAGHGDSGNSAASEHASSEHSGHRRLRGEDQIFADTVRTLVPAAVQWPSLMEPEHLVCAPQSAGGMVAALTTNGFGAFVPPAAAAGRSSGLATSFSLDGLSKFGAAHSLSWSKDGLLVATKTGESVHCLMPKSRTGTWDCSSLSLPALPLTGLPATLMDADEGDVMRAAIALPGNKIAIFELTSSNAGEQSWQKAHEVFLHGMDRETVMEQPEVVSITTGAGKLMASLADGAVHYWHMRDGKPIPGGRDLPEAGGKRTWHSACALPDGSIMRLASAWRKSTWQPELLM